MARRVRQFILENHGKRRWDWKETDLELNAREKEEVIELRNIGADADGIASYLGLSRSQVGKFLESFMPQPSFGGEGILESPHNGIPEAFADGYRMALAHVKLHGMKATHEHWWRVLTPWVRGGLDSIPPQWRAGR